MLPERWRRNPPQRPAPKLPTDDASTLEPDVADEPNADDDLADDLDEEDEQLTDEAFLKALRADVQSVREGTIPSITDAVRPSPKDRPWGRRHKVRDKHGKVY